MLTIGATALPVTYLLQLFDHIASAVNMRRSTGWILAISLAWCGWTESSARREVVAANRSDLADLLDDLRELRDGTK